MFIYTNYTPVIYTLNTLSHDYVVNLNIVEY